MVRFGAKKVESFHLFYFTKKGAQSPFLNLNTIVYLLSRLKTFGNFRPVNHAKKRFYIIGSAVLIV